jgi:hypothetical protein
MSRPSHPPRFYHPNISWSSSLCSLLHPPATSSLLRPNILLSTPLWNRDNLWLSLSVRDQVSHPYKSTGRPPLQQYEAVVIHTLSTTEIIQCTLNYVAMRLEWRHKCQGKRNTPLSVYHHKFRPKEPGLEQGSVTWQIHTLATRESRTAVCYPDVPCDCSPREGSRYCILSHH